MEKDIKKDNEQEETKAEGIKEEQEFKGEQKEVLSNQTKDNQEINEENTEEVEELEGEEETDLDILQNKVNLLDGKIEDLEDEKESYLSKLQRLQADFNNYRNRMGKEREKIRFITVKEILDELLPIIDNFERALNSAKQDDDFVRGVDMIYRQLLKFLEGLGVKSIKTIGEHFDHNLHEAMLQVEDENYESGIIIEEFEKGYIMGDRVIRPAKVKVAQ